MRILVIAEDCTTRSRAVALLQDLGYSVVAANDSLDVLAVINQHTPQLILLDTPGPASRGLEVLQALRSRRPPRMLPAILLATDATLFLTCDSHEPRTVANHPIALHEVLAHIALMVLTAGG